MRIDAHQHFWKIERGDYGWITAELPVLYRDFGPADLAPLLDTCGIDRSIAVQAAPTLEETRYLLSLSETSERIAGVVGWLDLFDPACREQYEAFVQHPRYVGFRIMFQEMEDVRQCLQPSFIERLAWFAERDIPIDLLVRSSQLDTLVELVDQVPGLRGVVDHLGKPNIAAGELDPWREQLRRLAAHPGICCKLSGMVTEANPNGWQLDDFVPYVRHVLDVFGPQRVMFGSDWPVCRLAADYDQVVDVLEHALPETLTEDERALLFGGNAARFYKLPPA